MRSLRRRRIKRRLRTWAGGDLRRVQIYLPAGVYEFNRDNCHGAYMHKGMFGIQVNDRYGRVDCRRGKAKNDNAIASFEIE